MKRFMDPIQEFLKLEAASGILLAVCTLLALWIANSQYSGIYLHLLEFKIAGLSVHHWVNDALMVIFFFVVGMEIKKEIIIGELSTPRKAALPIAGALGGMILPALLYVFLNPKYPEIKGWGIPMATDIAFAVAVLSFFRVPFGLKIFLLALAIVDDLGAVLVIAFFYTKEIHFVPLLFAGGLLGLIVFLQKNRISNYFLYVLIGIGVWVGVLLSGVHATIAGVALGLLTPIKFKDSKKEIFPSENLIHALHPFVSFLIMPIFALVNAGVVLQGVGVELLQNPIHRGVALGLFLGKPLGIFLLSFITVKMGWAQLPSDVKWGQILAVGFLGGIGFTMALFISALALYPEQEIFSQTGILLGSLLAAKVGSILMAIFSNKKAAN